ncbi:unnamed protein product [Clonostachys byssicola]|uniref:Uncharacterized protein n=1 Tax=Clonostachys byssicola TaxID=160290 RepID=A0A9N9UC65_9HYPO|nr:unnamed protein product [Clonostachys byssicola]
MTTTVEVVILAFAAFGTVVGAIVLVALFRDRQRRLAAAGQTERGNLAQKIYDARINLADAIESMCDAIAPTPPGQVKTSGGRGQGRGRALDEEEGGAGFGQNSIHPCAASTHEPAESRAILVRFDIYEIAINNPAL